MVIKIFTDLTIFSRNKEDYKYSHQAIEQRSESQMNQKYQSWRLICYALNDGKYIIIDSSMGLYTKYHINFVDWKYLKTQNEIILHF